MADLKDKQIRLVGSKDFAYATGSDYTQGHVHFTTDEHGSIVVNGKVYGTTDAAYVYVGSENIPTHVANAMANALDLSYEYTDDTLKLSYAYTNARISQLHENTIGEGKFVYRIEQTNGYVSAYKDTLQSLVTVDNSEAKAYAPKGTNENVKFIKSFEIEGDTIIPKYDYFANNLPDVPNVTVSDANYSGCYLPEFSASGHTITITNGAQVVSYNEFSEHLEEVKEMHELVDRFFSGADLDTETVKSYIDTLSEIQEAFKNSYAEGIANSVNNIQLHGNSNLNTSYDLWITYTTNGNPTVKQTAYVNIPFATDTAYGLVKYDDNTIKKNTSGQLYVDGKLTDTNYSMNAANHDDGAYVKLVGTDGTATTVQFEGTGIATVSYSSSDKAIKIHVPETVVNYDHHSTAAGVNKGNAVIIPSNGSNIDHDNSNAYTFINSVNLSADGKLTYSYFKLKHETSFNEAYVYTGPQNNTFSNGSIVIPKLVFNAGGHLTAYENINITGIAHENHTHDEFVWL